MNKVQKMWLGSTALLRGDDGMVSFSKCVMITLLVGWFLRIPLSATLALVFIGASYGWKGVQMLIERKYGSGSGYDDAYSPTQYGDGVGGGE